MSTRPRTPTAGKLPLPELVEMKRRGERSRWSPPTTRPPRCSPTSAGVELILVGDTAAMVMLGHESTVPVTLDEMIFLTRAVTRAAPASARRGRPAVRHATRCPTSRPSRARSAW